MTTATELARLRKLKELGLASNTDLVALDNLEKAAAPAAPAHAGNSAAPGEVSGTFIRMNMESFKRGGAGFYPPSSPGVYPAICTGSIEPERAEDQRWFIFESTSQINPFRGALVCAALNAATERSGAWKMKEVLDVLAAPYSTRDDGIVLGKIADLPCQVLWESVKLKDKTELRIQNVLPAATQVGQAV